VLQPNVVSFSLVLWQNQNCLNYWRDVWIMRNVGYPKYFVWSIHKTSQLTYPPPPLSNNRHLFSGTIVMVTYVCVWTLAHGSVDFPCCCNDSLFKPLLFLLRLVQCCDWWNIFPSFLFSPPPIDSVCHVLEAWFICVTLQPDVLQISCSTQFITVTCHLCPSLIIFG
jgi:hypothetical protein